ncbi:YciI family protein [Flindersiella endophytica]
MSRYAMLIVGQDVPYAELPEGEVDTTMAEIDAWFTKWSAAGKVVPGGAELNDASMAKTVRAAAGGPPVITDGPYAELKEYIGGVVYLEADDIDDAVAIASEWPRLQPGSMMTAVEVRPIIQR